MTPSKPKPTTKVRSDRVSGSSSGSLVWIIVVVAVVVVGVAAVLMARDRSQGPALSEETGKVELLEPASGGSAEVPTEVKGGLPKATDLADPAIGMRIPTVKGTTVDGKPITIGAERGPKVIVFMAHWCPHCRKEIPLLVDHFAAQGFPDGVKIYGISTAVDDKSVNYPPSRWLKSANWTVPTLADSADAEAYRIFGAGGFPYFIAVDANGKVVARNSGELSMQDFDALVAAAQGK